MIRWRYLVIYDMAMALPSKADKSKKCVDQQTKRHSHSEAYIDDKEPGKSFECRLPVHHPQGPVEIIITVQKYEEGEVIAKRQIREDKHGH